MKTTNPQWLKRLKTRRKLWLEVHLYLGLIFGVVLSIVGLTGSVLVFWQDIDNWINPSLRQIESQSDGEAVFANLATVFGNTRNNIPTNAEISFAYYPRDNSSTYQVFYSIPRPDLHGADQYLAFINPYSAKVTGIKLVKTANDWIPRAFMPFIFQLHYSMLLGENGSTLLGLIAVMLIISVLTGLIVWWPLTGRWKQAFTIKRNASKERFNYDLHKTAGIYSGLVLLALLVSGIEFNLPEQTHTLLKVFTPVNDRNTIKSGQANGRVAISIAKAADIVNSRYPDGRLDWIYNATEPDSTFTLCKRELKHHSHFIDRRCVVVDQYSGEILWVQEPNTGTAGDLFIQWLWPLHSGQAFGLSGRILVFITGLMCPILFITGLIHWYHKRLAKR